MNVALRSASVTMQQNGEEYCAINLISTNVHGFSIELTSRRLPAGMGVGVYGIRGDREELADDRDDRRRSIGLAVTE